VGKLLVVAGVIIAVIGLVIMAGVPLGRLPGDLVIRRGNSTLYLPITTCILISVVLSLLGMLWRR